MDQENEGKTIAGRHFRTETWSGATVHPPSLSTHTKPVSTNTSPFTGCPFPHLKQTWIKEFAIASNTSSNGRPKTLRFTREGLSSGIGAWKLYLWSDSFSVGSYLVPRLEFRNISPACNIYSIQIVISQQYSCKPLEQFFTEQESAAEHQYPFEPYTIHSEGRRPTDLSDKADPVLFRGRSNHSPASNPLEETPSVGDEYTWEPGKVRLPDDLMIRPSTSVGTRTPVNISHKITIKVMFSVTGQTVDNKPLPSPNSKGQLRMLLIDIYEYLPSADLPGESLVYLRPGMDKSSRLDIDDYVNKEAKEVVKKVGLEAAYHTIAIVKRAFPTLQNYPDSRIEFLLPSTDSETVTKDTKWFRMLDEAWVGLDTHPPSVMRVQVAPDALDLLKRAF
ncbi:hypothetical protein QFC19_003759 [Naganishia cerealis]|uniref:Uncharacterized protein n=1 Tax=Naganishia cerealis TaxID=610337 RepID=A0ACC2W028_9TREE|nr:hypothetical protein QFC19_003759 [Naganishia cerealis]